MEIYQLSAQQILERIAKKEVSKEEVFDSFKKRIEKINPQINAFISVTDYRQENIRGDEGRLSGVPIGVKDLFCTKGIRTTAASKALENFVPPYTATVVKNLLNEGAIISGKLNMDEFAMGSSNENSFFGAVKNPVDLEYVAGGSSGGSAAAVAAGLCPISLGSDTGGSIRLPASYCGVMGLKPTYGRMSRYGMISYASSLDQAGPLARRIEDLALATEIMSGFDEKDSTSFKSEEKAFYQKLKADSQFKVGVIKGLDRLNFDPAIKTAYEEFVEELRSKKIEIESIELSSLEHTVSIYYLIAMSEASSNLSRYDGVRFGYRHDFSKEPPGSLEEFYSKTRGEAFGKEVKRRILLGSYALSAGYFDQFYQKASLLRRKLSLEIEEAFKKVDLILSPVSTVGAFKIGERNKDPLKMYETDQLTTLANLTGTPAVSFPLSQKSKLPVGIQFIAPHFKEQSLLDFGLYLQSEGLIRSEVQDVL